MGGADRPEPAAVLTARALITGRVQGVFFRASAAREARARSLAGWVRNLPDGSVEAHVQGERDAVEGFLAWCHDGPPGARVQDVRVEKVPPDPGLSAFTIR